MPCDNLILKLATPSGDLSETECDSVHLCISEDENGKGGGSYGIRRGHADAIISLASGEISAYMQGKEVLRVKTDVGIATVKANVITVVTDRLFDDL